MFVIITTESFGPNGLDDNNVNVEALQTALAAIAAGGTPDIPNDPDPNPNPNPTGPGTWTGKGKMDFLGTQMPIMLDGVFHNGGIPAGAPIKNVNVWAVLADLAAIYADARRDDWAAVAADVDRLLTDLELNMTSEQKVRFGRSLLAQMETAPLCDKCPPNTLDSATAGS